MSLFLGKLSFLVIILYAGGVTCDVQIIKLSHMISILAFVTLHLNMCRKKYSLVFFGTPEKKNKLHPQIVR